MSRFTKTTVASPFPCTSNSSTFLPWAQLPSISSCDWIFSNLSICPIISDSFPTHSPLRLVTLVSLVLAFHLWRIRTRERQFESRDASTVSLPSKLHSSQRAWLCGRADAWCCPWCHPVEGMASLGGWLSGCQGWHYSFFASTPKCHSRTNHLTVS